MVLPAGRPSPTAPASQQALPAESHSSNVRNLTDIYEQAVVKGYGSDTGTPNIYPASSPEGPAIEKNAKAGLIHYRGVDRPSPSIEVRHA